MNYSKVSAFNLNQSFRLGICWDKFLQSKTYRLYIEADNHCPKYTVQVTDGMPPVPNWNPLVFTHKTVRKSNTFYLTIVFSVLFEQNKVIEWKWALLLFTSGSPWTTRTTRRTWTPWAARSLGPLWCKFPKSQIAPLLNLAHLHAPWSSSIRWESGGNLQKHLVWNVEHFTCKQLPW